jgi:uncharacterized protein (DUF169 family)
MRITPGCDRCDCPTGTNDVVVHGGFLLHRQTVYFQSSGYNAQCVETTLIPFTTHGMNISLGCYGCRASSDVGDDLMFMGIHCDRMRELMRGLEALGKKAIPDSRNKIYLPPLT